MPAPSGEPNRGNEMPATITAKLPARKSSKESQYDWTPSVLGGSGLLRIRTKRATVEYLVIEFRADGGRAFRLVKCADETEAVTGTDKEAVGYDVFACGTAAPRCECRGYLSAGHCKHSDAMAAILGADHDGI